jgi:hypothetical protein
MTAEKYSQAEHLTVTTPEGYVVDLARLVTAARTVQRNALQDAEQGQKYAAIHQTMVGVMMGTQVAVRTLCGNEAARVFQEHTDPPAEASTETA